MIEDQAQHKTIYLVALLLLAKCSDQSCSSIFLLESPSQHRLLLLGWHQTDNPNSRCPRWISGRWHENVQRLFHTRWLALFDQVYLQLSTCGWRLETMCCTSGFVGAPTQKENRYQCKSSIECSYQTVYKRNAHSIPTQIQIDKLF